MEAMRAGDTAARSLNVLRPGGRLVVVAGALPDAAVAGVRQVTARWMLVEPDRCGLERLAALAGAGEVTVRVDAPIRLRTSRSPTGRPRRATAAASTFWWCTDGRRPQVEGRDGAVEVTTRCWHQHQAHLACTGAWWR